jgi:hypothetical protein
VLPLTLLVVLVSSTCGDQHVFCYCSLCRPPHQDWVERERLVSASPFDDTEPGPQLGKKQLPGERPSETAETRHTGEPSRYVRRKGAALLSGGEEQTARAISAYAQRACLLSLQIGSKI